MQDDEHVGFPAFLPRGHHLHFFSDGLFHRSCYENWIDKEDFLRLYQKFREIWASRPMNLRTTEEMDPWAAQAFRNFPGDDETGDNLLTEGRK